VKLTIRKPTTTNVKQLHSTTLTENQVRIAQWNVRNTLTHVHYHHQTTTTTTPTTNSNPPTALRRTLQPEPHSNKQTNYQTNGDNALEHLHLRSEATAHTHDLQELIPATAILTPATFNRNLTNARQRKQLTTRLASNTLEHLHPGFRATAHIHDLWVLVPATAILTLNASPHSAGTASG